MYSEIIISYEILEIKITKCDINSIITGNTAVINTDYTCLKKLYDVFKTHKQLAIANIKVLFTIKYNCTNCAFLANYNLTFIIWIIHILIILTTQ